MRLALTIALAIGILIGGGLALISYMNYAKYSGAYSELVDSRFNVLALDLKNNVEGGMALGFNVDQLDSLRGSFSRVLTANADVKTVAAFNTDGMPLLLVGEAMPSPGRNRIGEVNTGFGPLHWTDGGDAVGVVAVPVANRMDVPVAVVVMRYDRSGVVGDLRSIQQELFRIGVLAWAGTALLAVIIAVWVLKPLTKRLHVMGDVLNDVVQNRPVKTPLPAANEDNELEQHFNAFLSSLRGRGRGKRGGAA